MKGEGCSVWGVGCWCGERKEEGSGRRVDRMGEEDSARRWEVVERLGGNL